MAARDPETGDLGIAVESKYLAVGAIVPHGRAASGLFVTQFYAHPGLAPVALALLDEGNGPDEVLGLLLDGDPHLVRRQMVVMGSDGAAAAFTGDACLDMAGHMIGAGVAVSGNTLGSASVLDAMMEAYQRSAERPFWWRLMESLHAGQAEGGDLNGQQSASIIVLRDGAGYGGYTDRLIDLRVDDSVDPIGELSRLLVVWTETVAE